MKERLRVEMMEKERQMKNVLPFNGSKELKKEFRKLEKEVFFLSAEIKKIDKEEQRKKNALLRCCHS